MSESTPHQGLLFISEWSRQAFLDALEPKERQAYRLTRVEYEDGELFGIAPVELGYCPGPPHPPGAIYNIDFSKVRGQRQEGYIRPQLLGIKLKEALWSANRKHSPFVPISISLALLLTGSAFLHVLGGPTTLLKLIADDRSVIAPPVISWRDFLLFLSFGGGLLLSFELFKLFQHYRHFFLALVTYIVAIPAAFLALLIAQPSPEIHRYVLGFLYGAASAILVPLALLVLFFPFFLLKELIDRMKQIPTKSQGLSKRADRSPAISNTVERNRTAETKRLLGIIAFGPIYAVLYLLFVVPTYVLPYVGSNSAFVNAIGSVAGEGLSPAFWLHLTSMLVLILLALARGVYAAKIWIVVFPIIALTFDFVPALNFVPLVPTAMHLCAIIIGVTSSKA